MPSSNKIVFSRGFWWFRDRARGVEVKLDPLLQQSGWRVNVLSGYLGVGTRTFARVVEDSLGITGKIWLRQLRIVVACHMLREGEKMESLAKRLGFSNNANFTREFRKVIGVSPSEYLKLERIRSECYDPSKWYALGLSAFVPFVSLGLDFVTF